MAWISDYVALEFTLKNTFTLQTPNQRFSCVRLKAENLYSCLLFSVYFPTKGKDHEFLDCVSDLISFASEQRQPNETILVGCDSNCSETSSSRRKLTMDSLCTQLKLVKSKVYHQTFYHHNGSSCSNIDYFLVSKENNDHLV